MNLGSSGRKACLTSHREQPHQTPISKGPLGGVGTDGKGSPVRSTAERADHGRAKGRL